MAYEVASIDKDGNETVETKRTSERAAKDDVSLLKGICRKKVRMYEVPDVYKKKS